MSFPHIRLKKGRDKSVRNFHPWIFSGAVDRPPETESGGIVAVEDAGGALLGYGFYDARSQIICRMFSFNEPPESFASEAYWHNKLAGANKLRGSFIYPDTDCYRLLHAEGDGFPGLIVDAYKDVAVVVFLIEGTWRLKETIFSGLRKLGFARIYVRAHPGEKEGYWLEGAGDPTVEVAENGMKFLVNVEQGQKTGFFIDQRENRRLVGALAKGRRALNLFAYSGGFSVAALQGGATQVVSVDISAPAVDLCDRNVALNFPDAPHKSVVADAFGYLRETGDGAYDMIVIDPPAFAKSKGAVLKASRGYKDLNMIAMKKIAPAGLILTFSCSQHISADLFQKIVFSAAADAKRQVKILKRLQQPEDHPVSIFHPEGAYLKGLALWVE